MTGSITTPAHQRGFLMPPEWAHHAATWTAWPVGEDLWEGFLEPVRADMAGLVAALSRFEAVELLVLDAVTEASARQHLASTDADLSRITFHHVAYDDIWLRDSGPAFVLDPQGCTALVDFRFDGWGKKYEASRDDQIPTHIAEITGFERFEATLVLEGGAIEMGPRGWLLTTESCLLDGIRNPGVDKGAYERALLDQLGVRKVTWLTGGLVDDHTDGHVDTVVRWANDTTILCTVADSDDAANQQTLSRNWTALEQVRDEAGQTLTLVPLPLPRDRSENLGVRSPRTYANFCFVNGGVLVPVWNDPRDADALAIFADVFPEREIVPVAASALITGGGALHCVTQHQPSGGQGHDHG